MHLAGMFTIHADSSHDWPARVCEPYRYRYHLTCCVLMMILLLPRLVCARLVGLDPLIHAGTVGRFEMPVMAPALPFCAGLIGDGTMDLWGAWVVSMSAVPMNLLLSF